MNWTNPNTMIGVGTVGAAITALCCFTPVLVIALGAVGAGVAIAYLDMVLLPLLAIFLVVLAVGLVRARAQRLRSSDRGGGP